MPQSINGVSNPGHGHYAREVSRTAWREEMLAEVLAKVRTVAAATETARLTSPSRPPAKGGILDCYA